ncbi:hypothetical protein HYFRA_00004309 [Hymenoscyphus fraxineus]|uniref:Uncharacterized protein n=1 Tax=Hymenoscyphus fraxineus TaxID=746836 RepID=A0A9N9KQZ0_9HELO|nr:hypothetical protein HYFRA_00004309 [Hymenoscyphus fraxineus]
MTGPPRRLSPITNPEDLKFYRFPRPLKEILENPINGYEMARVTCPHTNESATMTAELAGALLTGIKENSGVKIQQPSDDEDEKDWGCPFTKPDAFIAVGRYKNVMKEDDDIISGWAHMNAACRYAKKSRQLGLLRRDEEDLVAEIMEEQTGRVIERLEVETKAHRARISNPIKTFEQMEYEYVREYLENFERKKMVLSRDEAKLKRVRADIRELGEAPLRFVPIFEYIPGNEEFEE